MLGGNPRELARYVAISQIGLLMAAPPGIGALLDHWLGWSPWGVVVGAVLGLFTGLFQLVRLANRQDDKPGEADRK